jgi:hypothetical protein
MAIGGWLVGNFSRRPTTCVRQPVKVFSPADEIAKLNLLRQEGVISETEFEREKARLLARN